MRDHLAIAGEQTENLSFPEALEWTEVYLSKQGIPIPSKLSAFLREARDNKDVEAPYAHQPLLLRPHLGAWGNLIAADGFNLLVASPKAGKSALAVHVFACSKRGDAECLGAPIRKRWNKLIISGNDMHVGDWGKILIREGLAQPHGDDHEQFLPSPDVLIWDVNNPARLNEKGIEAMRQQCEAHPDSLLLIDSLRSHTDASLDEGKAEIRGPIEKLKRALANCKVTVILIHHANKTVSGTTGNTASSGNNALPGTTDNSLLMKHMAADPVVGLRMDNRLILSSSGRLPPDNLLVELTSDGIGAWRNAGDVEQALREEFIHEAEERLTGRQRQVYEHAENIAENGVHMTTAEASAQLQLTLVQARKALEALVRKGLMVRCGTLHSGKPGREGVLYVPTLSALAHARIRESRGLRDQRVSNNSQSPVETFVTPKTLVSSSLGEESSQQPLKPHLQIGSKVEIQGKDGFWVVTCNVDPQKIRLEKWGSPSVVARSSLNLIRPSQPPADPYDF